MIDKARLAHLVEELGKKPSYATGERKFPEPIARDEAAAIARALAGELDAGTQARAELAAKRGLRIACKSGCAACCELVVMVWRPEAEAAAAWLARRENAETRAWFEENFRRWRERVGDAPERLAAASRAGGEGYVEAMRVEHARRIPCAFLRDGRCAIYPARPLGCRNAHALDTDERCRGDWTGPPPAAVAIAPVAEFLVSATRLLRATHNAVAEARHTQESLCVAVERLLNSPAPAATSPAAPPAAP